MTDLIKQVGGIENAKNAIKFYDQCGSFTCDCNFSYDDLRQAIADYNTDHCSDIENHISPSTVRIEK